MVRSFIVMLLLAVFFLTGMLLGIDRGSTAQQGELRPELESGEIAHTNNQNDGQGKQIVVEHVDNSSVMEMQGPVHLTQKTASILEAGVKGFYEAVVQVLYQIAQLFF